MIVKDYSKEFYKIQIRSGHCESSKEKFARYVNGLKFNIQDGLSMLKIGLVEDAYQYALKAED